MACFYGHFEEAYILLQAGANVHATITRTGYGPLHHVASCYTNTLSNKIKLAELLLDYGADRYLQDKTMNCIPGTFCSERELIDTFRDYCPEMSVIKEPEVA